MNLKAATILFCAFGILEQASVASATEALSFGTSINAQHSRTLAASCAACHGTNGNSLNTTPTLAGLDPSYFTTQMLAFKNGTRSATVMHHHAKGLTADEINELAVYFSEQDRITPKALKPQTFRLRHE